MAAASLIRARLLLCLLLPRAPAMLTGRAWWASLGSPRTVAAPMVGQSELAFRMLARRYGAELCYTPMYLAKLYAAVPEYRADHFSTCAADRPLIGQLAGHDPDTMVRAGLLLQGSVDAIDINLGCPQAIARKGRYGAYLLPDVERVCQIIRALVSELDVPVTCKVRLLPSAAATLDACRRFEDAGASALAVHGRRREQNKQYCGAADWAAIAQVRAALSVPLIANGGVSCADDVAACLAATGADAVMSSEALLGNPALFAANRHPTTGAHVSQRHLAREYLALAREHGAPDASARAHIFKMLHGALGARTALRDQLADACAPPRRPARSPARPPHPARAQPDAATFFKHPHARSARRFGLSQFEAVLDKLEALDPAGALEPLAHTAEGGSGERRALQWYFRYQLKGEARVAQRGEGAEEGEAGGGAEEGARSAERIARRVRRAQHKSRLRERHQERLHAKLGAAGGEPAGPEQRSSGRSALEREPAPPPRPSAAVRMQ